jgi:hypothetical protein
MINLSVKWVELRSLGTPATHGSPSWCTSYRNPNIMCIYIYIILYTQWIDNHLWSSLSLGRKWYVMQSLIVVTSILVPSIFHIYHIYIHIICINIHMVFLKIGIPLNHPSHGRPWLSIETKGFRGLFPFIPWTFTPFWLMIYPTRLTTAISSTDCTNRWALWLTNCI